MTQIKSFPATGTLLAGAVEQAIGKHRHLRAIGSLAPGWNAMALESETPLHGEMVQSRMFVYNFLLRRSAQLDHFLICGLSADLVMTLLGQLDLLSSAFAPHIAVDRLVRDFVAAPTSYSLSAVYTRIRGFRQMLRSMSFFGSDIASAPLFRNLLPDLQPYRVTFRDLASGIEIGSIGSRGEVNFAFSGPRSLSRVNAALAFLHASDYIDWEKRLKIDLTR
jgi:hypothetical protein